MIELVAMEISGSGVPTVRLSLRRIRIWNRLPDFGFGRTPFGFGPFGGQEA